MKKRILSILLLCCMVLTLLPTVAFAAGKIWVGTEEELLAALADNTIDKITLTADITVSQTLVIDRQVVLVLDHSLKIDREQSSSGTLFHITKSGYLDTNAGSITDNVLNEGRFYPLQISGEVINEGEIIRGSFSGKVKNRGSINYGSFRGEVENAPGGKIANGELYGEVTNHGEIAGWKFYGKVTNDTDGLITSGEFYGEVVNNGRITGGEFSGDVVNNGEITGGSFFGTLTGNEIQGDLYRTVTFDSDGGSAVAPQQVLQGQKVQRPADPIKDGHTFIGWYNKADLQYINLPEWNFDYPVFENMELVAQWMEAMPISTVPVAYLDENGQTKYCTAYTVLTSETKASILDYDDKWYDLPAGWYVVEGDVTITPRLDTHGAVNLILTNGSHLTAEWGIDVKVGDTFTVYAQSTDEGTMGRLTACLPADFNLDRMVHYSVWPYSGMAGIGSSARWRAGNDGIRESEGTIIINGGNIRAKGQDSASAIGGPLDSEIEFRYTDRGEVYNRRQGGSITINGGIVRTEPFALPEGNPLAVTSVGIGTCHYGYGGSVTINGGTVIAEAANDAITTGDGGTITINGGDVTARGGVNNFGENSHRVLSGNGIGPLENGSITINGGTVKATAKGNGFGIGGSRFEIIGTATVTINGGTIEATANRNNAAIGDRGTGKSGVTITGGIIHAVGKGGAAGIGSKGNIRITGGEITVSAEGSGAAIGGFTNSYSERVDCESITINGDVIKSISSKDGACIGGAAGGSVGSITISDAKLPSLSAEKILIGWDADSPGGKLTIRNCRVASTDTLSVLTDGIRVGSNSELVIEESEIRLPHLRGIRVGGNGSIAVRDSDLHTYGIFMDETVHTITDAKTLKKLEITDSTVLTGDIIGARGEYSSVEEVVIRGSSIRLNEEYTYNYCTIGGGTKGSFGSIDIQNSQIHIPSPGLNTAIGNGHQADFNRESHIRIANSQVFVGGAKFGPAIGAAYGSSGGQINILIENSTVTAKGGNLRSDTDYIPGIGKNSSGRASEIGKIQILNSTVESFRLEEKDGTNYVYDDLHTKELPGIPAENISICGSTVNGTRIDHSFDEYGKCTLCGKYDLGYCYEHGLLTLEGLTDCVSDGSEKKLTGLSHQTGENETKQLAENTDYTAVYSNNVHPYTLKPDNEGFDSEKAPKVTLYGTGNYCGKAEHYFTISAEAPAAEHTVTVTTAGNGTASAIPAKAVAGVEITLTAMPDKGYHFKEWQVESPAGLVITNNKFLMPDSNVEVKAIFEEDVPPAPTDPAKPSISVTGTYTYNGSEHTATVSGYDSTTMDISGNTATDAGDYTVSVTSKTGKWADGSTDTVTATWKIGKATQEAPISLTGTAPTTVGGNDGKISGVDSTMEYRMAGASSYAACSGTEIENLSAGNYFVRYAEDNNHFASSDTVVTVGEGAPLADCTITFNAGGGSGSMEPVTVKAGTNYILPDCGFIAPTDQEFKAWEIGGTEYEVGDSYTVLGDTEIKALWKNSVITPTTYTVTVSNDGNGTGTAAPSTAAAGTTITLTATPNKGYHFKEWQVMSGGVTIKDDKFLMPNDNVEVKAIFEKDAPSAEDLVDPMIRIIPGGYGYPAQSGTLTAADFFQPGKAPANAKITAIAPPASPSILDSISVDNDGLLSYAKNVADGEQLETDIYTVTITSDDYEPISAPLTVRQYLFAGFTSGWNLGTWVYGDTRTYKWKVLYPGENGTWSAVMREQGIFEVYEETVDTTSEPGVSHYTTKVRAIKAGQTFIDILYVSDTTAAWSPWSGPDIVAGGWVFTRPLAVTAGSATITKGDALPTDLVRCTGLLDSEGRTDDRDTVLDNALSYRLLNANNEEVTAATARNTPGTYTVVPTAALKSGWDERYSLNRVNGTLTVENKVEEQFTVTVTSGGNGTVSASHAKATAGTEITLNATPNTGYHFKEWQVISGGGVTIKDNKFLMPSANVEVKAIFEKDAPPAPTEFIVTFDGNGGTPSAGSMTTTDQKLPSLPSASRSGSYSFDGWYTEKSGGTKITTDTVFFANTTVYAHWMYTGGGSSGYSYYTIKATAGTGGSISPSGNVSVREGRDQTFTITPDKGYAVSTVKIDGKSIGAVKSYTFENVSRTHTIEVIFVKGTASANTGDSSNLPLWSALLLASTLTLAGAVHYKRKRAR